MNDNNYPDALPLNYRLHWYVLQRVLGQGGFGITYLAHDPNLDRLVAIKEYLPGDVAMRRSDGSVRPRSEALAERYRWGLERFLTEARTLARFDHPNIVRVHSVFEANDSAYMVMRFEEGDTLAQLLERRVTLPHDELLRVLLPILDGLQLVHGAGFIHRDIKPENIHIRRDGSPVLLDFGSARQSLGRSRTMTILVAPGYAPLEQYYGDPATQGPWTDIYGLAATCYRAIAGEAPMDAIARTKNVLGSVREALKPAVEAGRGRYDAAVLKAIDHGLQLSEKDRPQSVADWYLEISGQALSPPGARSETQAAVREPPGVPVVTAPVAAPGRAHIGWALGGAVAAVLVIATYFMLHNQQREIEKQRQQLAAERVLIEAEQKAAESRRAELAATKVEAGAAVASPAAKAESKSGKAAPAASAPPGAAKPAPLAPPRASVAPATVQASPVASTPPQQQPAALPTGNSIAPADSPAKDIIPAPPAAAPPSVVAAATAPPRAPAVTEKSEAQQQLDLAQSAMQRGAFADALAVLRPLSQSGNALAQLLLADLYAGGKGLPADCNAAYMWYGVAARRGNADAPARQTQLTARCRLQAAEIRNNDRLIQEWRPRAQAGAATQ